MRNGMEALRLSSEHHPAEVEERAQIAWLKRLEEKGRRDRAFKKFKEEFYAHQSAAGALVPCYDARNPKWVPPPRRPRKIGRWLLLALVVWAFLKLVAS